MSLGRIAVGVAVAGVAGWVGYAVGKEIGREEGYNLYHNDDDALDDLDAETVRADESGGVDDAVATARQDNDDNTGEMKVATA